MNTKHERIEHVFWRASQMESKTQREAFLAEACSGDDELRSEVDDLLAAMPAADKFAEAYQPIIASVGHAIGETIGRYKLQEKIGEGGFGIVFVAAQSEPVRRKVALKLIKPGMDCKQVVARFEAERQALALMNHPNVARMFDAGSTNSGQPYFVMELVYGTRITTFCDENKLSIEQRLKLFVDVCHAVHHAHLKGIIHRDLKPSNILVTMNGDKPMPKVIDFGVAKALTQPLTEQSLYTAYGQLIGTPMYMSPEQAQLSAQDVDVRTDVYSLGVLLYELLTGHPPFDREALQSSGFDEMRRLIREVEPPRPSSRVSTLAARALTTIAQQRGVDERKLQSSLGGDLNWIVMKSIEKNRELRYESAAEFSQDLGRFLADEVVVARPPSLHYRFQKSVRKHRVAYGIGSFIAISLIIALAGLGFGLAMVTQERNLTKGNLARSLYNEANALRFARTPGYRNRVTELLRRARNQHPNAVTAPMAKHAIAACMGDFAALDPQVRPLPAGGTTHGFDPRTSRLVVTDAHGRLVLLGSNGKSTVLNSSPEHRVSLVRFHHSKKSLVVVDQADQVRIFRETDQWRGSAVEIPPGLQVQDVFVAGADESVLVCGTHDSTLIAARCRSDRPPQVLSKFRPPTAFYAAGFSGDGRRLVIRQSNTATVVVNVGSNEPLRTILGSVSTLPRRSSLCDDNDLIVYGHRHGTEIVDGGSVRFISGPNILATAVSPDGTLIATLDEVGRFRILSRSRNTIALLDPPRNAIARARLAFHSDGLRISMFNDVFLCTWRVTTPERIRLHDHRGGVPCVKFNSDGGLMASASADGTVKIWDSQNGILKHEYTDFSYPECLAFGRRDQLIIGDQNGKVTMRSLATGEVETIRHSGSRTAYSVATSDDCNLIAIADLRHGVEVYQRNGEGVFASTNQFEGHGTVKILSDDRHLIWLTGGQSEIRFRGFDMDTQKELSGLPDSTLKTTLKSIAINELNELAFISRESSNRDGNSERAMQDYLKVWDLHRKKEIVNQSMRVAGVPQLSTGEAVSRHGHYGIIASSEDGQWLATAMNDLNVVVWKRYINRYESQWVLPSEADTIWSMDWSPDASQLAVGTSCGEISIWIIDEIESQFEENEWLK